MPRSRFALVGQCRGDLALFVRQLAHVGVLVSFVRGKLSITAKSDAAKSDTSIVILGDLICPLNAWSSYQPAENHDARILEVAVTVAERLGAALVCGLHEQMLLRGDNARCMQGTNHRRLLKLVLNSKFRAALAKARANDAHGVACAGKTPEAILSDNETREPPPDLAPYWDRMSLYDRGTRFVCRTSKGSFVDLPVLGLGSSALAVHPLAMRDHIVAEYGKLRSAIPQWKATVEAIGAQYAAFDRARRRCLVVTPHGIVPDREEGVLAGTTEDLRAPLTRALEDIVERYSVRGATAAELYAVTIRALGL